MSIFGSSSSRSSSSVETEWRNATVGGQDQALVFNEADPRFLASGALSVGDQTRIGTDEGDLIIAPTDHGAIAAGTNIANNALVFADRTVQSNLGANISTLRIGSDLTRAVYNAGIDFAGESQNTVRDLARLALENDRATFQGALNAVNSTVKDALGIGAAAMTATKTAYEGAENNGFPINSANIVYLAAGLVALVYVMKRGRK